MRHFTRYVLILLAAWTSAGCGGGGGIEPGVPKDADSAPKFIEPGGDAKPDMKGGPASKI